MCSVWLQRAPLVVVAPAFRRVVFDICNAVVAANAIFGDVLHQVASERADQTQTALAGTAAFQTSNPATRRSVARWCAASVRARFCAAESEHGTSTVANTAYRAR